MNVVPPTLDHLVYATLDLDAAVTDLERMLGVRATPGGVHPGRGSRNALIAIGPAAYLEILGPDPAQPATTKRWFQLGNIQRPTLVAWAIRTQHVAELAAEALQHGIRLGPVMSGSRRRPDGVELRWQYTDPATVVADGVVPFLIDWKDSPHPVEGAMPGPPLVGLRAEHPDAEDVRRMLLALGIELPVQHGPRPALIATLRSGERDIELT